MQFMDWSVQSINCHIAIKAMFYLLMIRLNFIRKHVC